MHGGFSLSLPHHRRASASSPTSARRTFRAPRPAAFRRGNRGAAPRPPRSGRPPAAGGAPGASSLHHPIQKGKGLPLPPQVAALPQMKQQCRPQRGQQ